jgi:hypothetical protein
MNPHFALPFIVLAAWLSSQHEAYAPPASKPHDP